jgi:uncharacterized protein YuzE
MTWNYDQASDVLYISIGEPQPSLSVDMGDGLVLRYKADQSAIVGLTILNLKSRLNKMQPTLTENNSFRLLDVVALTAPLPEHSLFLGQVGTIVETLAPDIYEVEFNDDNGQTYATLPIKAEQLIRLHYSPFDPPTNPIQTMSNTINQYGQGDNIAGDKVLGDKIQTQINNNPDLAQSARDIKALLNELSEEYNPDTEKGKAKIKDGALAQIRQNPQLKQRTLAALKSAGEEALEQAIQHPIAKVVVEGVKGFLEG